MFTIDTVVFWFPSRWERIYKHVCWFSFPDVYYNYIMKRYLNNIFITKVCSISIFYLHDSKRWEQIQTCLLVQCFDSLLNVYQLPHRKRYLNVFLSPTLVDFLMDGNMKTCLSWFTVTVTIIVIFIASRSSCGIIILKQKF